MMQYTPFAGQMGASLAGTMPTLGNRQAVQQQEQISLAQLLESYKQAQERGQLGQQMLQSEFVQGSGALGALAQMAQAYMGGKIRRKSGETAVELAERITRAQTEAEQAKALQAQQAKIAEQQQLMDARRKAYGNEQEMFALTGDVTKPTRGVPMMTDQGLVIVDPATNQYQMATPQGQPQTVNNPIPAPPSGGLDFAQLRALVEKQESGGNPNAVSPKGAMGRMQTMPTTLTDPGFGIQPARDRSDAEMTRVGNEYLSAMLNKYGDQRLALAAYNWGPGNVDNALKRSGGDVNAVLAGAPAETQGYVQKILGGQQQAQARPNAPLRPYEKPVVPKAQSVTLSPKEIAALGLPAGTLAQRNSETGDIEIKNKPDAKPTAQEAQQAKIPQLNNVTRGLDRIDKAIAGLDGMFVDTGPADQFLVGRTKAGQEFESAIGGIQNSMLALTRVPGMGSQSDLEAKIASLQYPSLDKDPEVNRRTLANLRAFVKDLETSFGVKPAAPANDDDALINKYLNL